MFELMGFDQTARAIMLEDESVPPAYFTAAAILWEIEMILDEFEDDIVTRQSKDDHHHPPTAFSCDETISGRTQMPNKIAIELGLAVPVISNRIVKIHQPLMRHQRTQVTHHLVYA